MKYLKRFESFEYNVDEDSEHLKDLSLDLQDEGEWSITIHTNTEKYNEDKYSCKVILEPLDEFDEDGEDINDRGGRINETLIQYLEEIVKYMEDYDYKVIICDSDQYVRQNTIDLENLEEFKKWIKREIGFQGKTKSTEDDGIVLSTEYPEFLNFGFKGDFIIIEFYEKDDEINESNIPYKYDWCRPESSIRKEIEEYINDIIKSSIEEEWRYTYQISWIQDDPYIWISGKIKGPNAFSRYKPVLEEVEPAIKQIKSYLNSEGFSTEIKYSPNKENSREFYIYFKMNTNNETVESWW